VGLGIHRHLNFTSGILILKSPSFGPHAWLFVNIRFVAVERNSTKVLAQLSLRDAGCLGYEVILLRDTRCSSGGNSVVFDGAFIVANHFEQMGANRVETIVTSKPSVGIERP
jgi:hypothetical protein